MPEEVPAKKKRNRRPRPFDPSKLSPDDNVTMRNIAQFSSYAVKYLYNLRSRGQFIEPVRNTRRALRFRWGDVLAWWHALPPTAHKHGHKPKG